jgi:hypothetical protein
MKKMFLATLLFSSTIGLSAQPNPETPTTTPSGKGMFYTDLSPLFFASGGWGFAVGYEKKRIQSGINFVGVKKLEGQLASGLLEDYTKLDIRDNLGAEWMFNYFLKPTRKGFYAGAILGYSQFNIKNIEKNTASQKAVSVYGDLRLGYRWFPFKEYFYIDAAYGFSRRIVSTSSSDYTFKSDFSFFPFMNVGARFSLGK